MYFLSNFVSQSYGNKIDLLPYDWLTQKSKDSTVFVYWKCVIDLQIKVLLYVYSIREGNFKLHVEVLYKLLSWYFIIYGHYNYARWLTIYCFDLYIINTKFPNVYNFLSKGNFSFQKPHREFSRMGWIKSMSRIISLSKGVGEQVIYLTRWTIQPLFAGKLVVPIFSVS